MMLPNLVSLAQATRELSPQSLLSSCKAKTMRTVRVRGGNGYLVDPQKVAVVRLDDGRCIVQSMAIPEFSYVCDDEDVGVQVVTQLLAIHARFHMGDNPPDDAWN